MHVEDFLVRTRAPTFSSLVAVPHEQNVQTLVLVAAAQTT